jgi:(p)ppGpp synthase/HD superfamily hydrolase
MELLKASEYRRLFLAEIGFPLIRANALRFVPEVGDLRKVVNLKLVYEAAMTWKAEQQEKKAFLENRIAQLETEVEKLKEQAQPEPEQPEKVLAEYLAEVPEEVAEAVITAVVTDKASYRKLAKFLHPDTAAIAKDKAEALTKIANHVFNRPTYSLSHESKQSKPSTGSSFKNEYGLDDLDF